MVGIGWVHVVVEYRSQNLLCYRMSRMMQWAVGQLELSVFSVG